MSRKNSGTTFEEDADNTEVLEDENRSIIMGLIAQLRKGTDLSRITLPTFVLEPRSLLEKFTDFMSHPELVVKYVYKQKKTPLPNLKKLKRLY